MDIFKGNRRLEEHTIHAVDWACYLRHNSDGPISPFMFVYHNNEKRINVLMTDQNPFEYAEELLAKSEKPYHQVIIGCEGFLGSNEEDKHDAIIVQGFDIAQEEGVSLGQMIKPKEKFGRFSKLGKVNFLGNPPSILNKSDPSTANFSIEEAGFTAMKLTFDGLNQYMVFITHENPSVVGNHMRRLLRSKLNSEESDQLNGRFEFSVPPETIQDKSFFTYIAQSVIEEEKAADYAQNWMDQNRRSIEINVSLGDEMIIQAFEKETNTKEKQRSPNNDVESTKEHLEASTEENAANKKKPWWKIW